VYTLQSPEHPGFEGQGRCFFITGPGGTGKSFLLKSLQHWCNASRNSCVLLAPTGIAARNIDGNHDTLWHVYLLRTTKAIATGLLTLQKTS